MIPPDVLITRCHALGLTLAVGSEGNLRVSPPGRLPEHLREELKRHKAEVLAVLRQQATERPHPSITPRGDLIIPLTCDPRYRWWAGGMSVAEILMELNAPAEVWRRY